ncbi:uncharacterized protein L203_102314 [Cryptococcus depauperatus CBS 7841]|uniref:CENP-C homolog n=1 Tax=Cryptococcus depauperatus CBS 7841 TaxID=1295531 RepID=A0AAJ8JRI6_9TREE
MSRTPSRRDREERYVPYNHDPRNIGSRTGKPMPTNVPRRSNGFEDPEAFFRSPESTTTHVDRTISSVLSKSALRTPKGSVRTTTTNKSSSVRSVESPETPETYRRKRSRMSDLDDGKVLQRADDLLVDDDILAPETPGSFFPGSEPPSVPLPSRSRLPLDSPGLNTSFDAIPSPSRSRPSPRKSHLSATNKGLYLKTSRAEKVIMRSYAKEPEDGEEPLEEEEDDDSERDSRRANKSKSKLRLVPSPSPSHSGTSPSQSIGVPEIQDQDPEMSGFENDNTIDLGDEPLHAPMDDYDIDGNSSGEGSSEQLAIEDEEPGYDEGAPDREFQAASDREFHHEKLATNKVKRSKTLARRKDGSDPKNPVHIAKRRTREGSQPIRRRISELGQEGSADIDDNGWQGNFKTRRSGRQHYRPLDWWRGEKVEYARGHGLAVIKEIVTIPEEPIEPLASRRRKGGRAASTNEGADEAKKRKRGKDPNDETGWDDLTEPAGLVLDVEGIECTRKIACPEKLIVPKWVQKKSFKYQKVFGEGQFFASGAVHIPVGKKKNTKQSKDNVYVFFVWEGAVQVTCYRTSFVMARGSHFLIPRGNGYCIENIHPKKEARLFFVQARELQSGEGGQTVSESQMGIEGSTGQLSAGFEASVPSRSSGVKSKGSKRRVDASQSEEEQDESVQEEETPKAKKRKGRR